MSDPIVLAPYDPKFAIRAGEQWTLWRTALGDTLVALEHIGSTAIPDMIAKPVLDIMPIVTDLAALDAKRSIVEGMGFGWRGEFGLAGRRYCKRSTPASIIHAHCYALGDPGVARHLAFRDYLHTTPSAANAYAEVKQRCAALHPDDRIAYGACKSDWIRQTEALALKGAPNDNSD